MLHARMRASTGWTDACILNVSSRGLLINASATGAVTGSEVELRHGAHVIVAEVVWRKGTRAGLRTDQRVPVDEIMALSKAPAKELAGGKLHFVLNGSKLQGEWYLVRLRDGDQWLLIRGGANMKAVSKKQEDTSVLSGRSMRELSKGDRVWQSKSTTTTAHACAHDCRNRRPVGLPSSRRPLSRLRN